MDASQRRISNLRWYAPNGFAALGTLLSGLALADAGPATEPSSPLQEVVVTAQYREEKLQNIPIAITAITSQQI
jgi:iron complex outermembrane receptor protein